MKHLLFLIVLISLPVATSADAKFPFPQKAKYPYGIVPTNADSAKVQAAFEEFMTLYEEKDNLARIKHDNTQNTVSEGIGYGMMILVYMDNVKNNTQAKFDKLWAYYNNFLDTAGLMNWKINGFSGVSSDGRNSATDAELDVAVALMQAYKQWGDEKYLTDAKTLISKIAKKEVNPNGYLKPGDSWDTEKNISYFSTAALHLFKQASDFDWDKVINASYTLIKKAQNSTTGLIPNWCSETGTPSAFSGRGDYTYDATRTPWRLAWAYSWYGHQDAKETCKKIASWISTKTSNDPTKIVDGYKLDGTESSKYNNSTFVGPFGCAGMVDTTYQTWVDKCFSHLPTITEDKYYQISLRVITLLYLSGNMPDFWSHQTFVVPQKSSFSFSTGKAALNFNSADSKLIFSTGISGNIDISLYNMRGQRISIVNNRFFPAGINHVSIPSLVTGTYILKMYQSGSVYTDRICIIQ